MRNMSNPFLRYTYVICVNSPDTKAKSCLGESVIIWNNVLFCKNDFVLRELCAAETPGSNVCSITDRVSTIEASSSRMELI